MLYNEYKWMICVKKWFQFPKKGDANMLTGSFQHNIDAKGRMIMPLKFRESLGERFFATKGLDGCIFVFSEEEWSKLDENLMNQPLSKGRDIQRFFYGGLTECEVDKQGRVLIPKHLREFAKLEKDVMVIGLQKRAEIWSLEKWNEQNDSFMVDNDEVALKMEDLGI